MRRGTTPKLKITISGIELDALDKIIITIQQNELQINKAGDDITFDTTDDDVIYVQLTEQETLSLDADKNIQMQLRATTDDGNIVASNIKKLSVAQILYEEEMGDSDGD